jgi:hypothetical protein
MQYIRTPTTYERLVNYQVMLFDIKYLGKLKYAQSLLLRHRLQALVLHLVHPFTNLR